VVGIPSKDTDPASRELLWPEDLERAAFDDRRSRRSEELNVRVETVTRQLGRRADGELPRHRVEGADHFELFAFVSTHDTDPTSTEIKPTPAYFSGDGTSLAARGRARLLSVDGVDALAGTSQQR